MEAESSIMANAGPLGLLGFGFTTVLLNIHNAGIYPMTAMILAMGIAYGGFAQILAGIMEFKNGNTFGTVAFTSYGLFWWSLVLILVLPGLGASVFPAADSASLAAYFGMWGIFTFVMFFATLKISRGLQVVFISLAALFFLLMTGEITGSALIGTITGYEGIFCGFSAIYVALAEVINEVYSRSVLPV